VCGINDAEEPLGNELTFIPNDSAQNEKCHFADELIFVHIALK
jgi:hypothetical protein